MTRALIGMVREKDSHLLAGRICRVCVECLQVDGAAMSLLTATEARETLSVTDATAATVEDLQFTAARAHASRRLSTAVRCWYPTSTTAQ